MSSPAILVPQHPDWWPLVKGKRQKPTQAHSHSTQLGTTNAEMVALQPAAAALASVKIIEELWAKGRSA